MNNKRWDKRHGKILSTILSRFNDENIRYFILRNYEGLPEVNPSKDVDIIVDPVSHQRAKNILKEVYVENNITYYYEVHYAYLHCCHGINIDTKLGIHLDIIGSYVSKGSEIFTFDELYSYTENYNDFRILNKFFEGVMVFIYKQFNYNPVLKEEYKEIIYNTHKAYPEFKNLISSLIGSELTSKIFIEIEQKNFDNMLMFSDE
ncbi:MAG: hypothetical protein KAI79_14830, partial [Bacteroidales bacterium]|nr:hypothetical protein [Bacteroidales bacterium]